MRLGDLVAGLDVKLSEPGWADVRVCDLTEDSRTALPGSLFVARRGLKQDGRAFAAEAVAAGADAVLTDDPGFDLGDRHRAVAVVVTGDMVGTLATVADRFYGSPSKKLALIGVTGTNGKTTTSGLIHQLLNRAGVRCGLIGTVVIDDGREVAPAVMTTPPIIELVHTLSVMVECGCKAAAIEVSSHALEQGRVLGQRFAGAVFTNLTGDHLDYHGTTEAYAAAKGRLMGMVDAEGVVAVNADDAWGEWMAAKASGRVVRCSMGGAGRARADVTGELRSRGLWGSRVEFRGGWGRLEGGLPLIGSYNAMNALEALSVVDAVLPGLGGMGVSGLAAQGRGGEGTEGDGGGLIEGLRAPPGRLEALTREGNPIAVFVDYAHTDDALRNVMGALNEARRGENGGNFAKGRLWVVFGCGGDRDRTKRPRMGAAVAEMADVAVVTSDNPRTEDPMSIIEMVVSGMPAGKPAGGVRVEPDRERAIGHAVSSAREGDVVLIAGKGHETYQILPSAEAAGGTVTRAFDDRVVASAALKRRGIEPGWMPIEANVLGTRLGAGGGGARGRKG